MKILICVEFFHPSVGGVQEVIKQISSRLVKLSHNVTIATSSLVKNTKSTNYKKIKVKRFNITGNFVKGIHGNVKEYQNFVVNGGYDLVFIYAAQQWTFDSLIDKFNSISSRIVFVPCGFSSLYDPEYKSYFKKLNKIYPYIDSFIFHSFTYRDYKVIANKYKNKCFLVENAADLSEFDRVKDTFAYYRKPSAFNLLNVGSFNGLKGQLTIIMSLWFLPNDLNINLLLNGNIPKKYIYPSKSLKSIKLTKALNINFVLSYFVRRYYLQLIKFHSFFIQLVKKNITIKIDNLSRPKLVKAYKNADLFVFTSNIEYSPLVIFECIAAGLPFISSSVGNVPEIIKWTRSGEIIKSKKDNKGFTSVHPRTLALTINSVLTDHRKMLLFKKNTLNASKIYNWDNIFKKYYMIFTDEKNGS